MITEIKTKDREEWKELRSHYIGGSDAAAVVGLNPFKSAYTLWADKTKQIPEFTGNLATEVGTYLEEFVAKKFSEETGKKVRRNNRSMINDKYPWAIANIDREIVGENAGLEIKTTSEINLKRFKNGEYPANYYCQCVHYMAVTGKDKWYLAVLIGNRDFKWFAIERDEDEINALMQSERDFWKLVEAKTPPAPDGSASTSETVNTIYPEANGNIVNLIAYDDAIFQYIAIAKQIKELKAIQDELANNVKVFMADSGAGESEKYRVSWPSSVRRTFDINGFEKDHPNMDLSEYYKTSNVRTFRVTEKK